MTRPPSDCRYDFSVRGARRCAREGRIEDWVHTYLNTGAWANKPLSDGLRRKERFWVGPTPVRLDNIDRLCGPEEGMIYREPRQQWERRLARLQASIDDLLALPPLIVNTNNGLLRNADGSLRFVIADGSHRLEALKRRGEKRFYALIWFETQAQRQEYLRARARPAAR